MEQSRRDFLWSLGAGAVSATVFGVSVIAIEELNDGKGLVDVIDDTIHEKERPPRILKGIDYSYPQKTAERYRGQQYDFVIVGVNGGKSTLPNDYLVEQLKMARELTRNADPNQTGVLPIQLYLNTANPVDYFDTKLVKNWPMEEDSDIQYNPYGAHDRPDSRASMYTYGWQQARESIRVIFKDAAGKAGISDNPADYMVWLDAAEETNTWREGDERAQKDNQAVLEGAVACAQSMNVGVGLYAARNHWNRFIGRVGPESNLYDLQTWLALGPISEEDAMNILTEGDELPFTDGGRVAMVQRVEGESAEADGAQDYVYAIAPR